MTTRSRIKQSALGAALLGIALLLDSAAHAQPASPQGRDKAPPSAHTASSHKSPKGPASAAGRPAAGDELAAQLEQLRMQVATLENALRRHGPGMGAAQPAAGPAMGQGGMGMGMKMDDMMGMGSGGMTPGGMGMGCCPMMGQMPAGAGMAMSALPGFPGASHLYHVGETGFFLDHPGHVTLSPEQASRLGKIREDALRAQGASARKVAEAEEQLWQLTAAEEPSAAAIEAKVREIEKLRGDGRLAFVRAVGEAAKVLTEEQRKALLGQLPPAPNPAAGMGPAMPQPGGSMGGGMMMDDDAMEMPPSGGGAGMGHM